MNGDFLSMRDVFELLNSHEIKYLILRNYEYILTEELYVDGHGDIDILCEDSQIIVNLLGARTDMKDIEPFKGDGVHYYIYVAKTKVYLDLRYVGDDYYCEKWEHDMLSKREKRESYYILPPLDYFYSLIYHAILQKKCFSEEYQIRLKKMANIQNVNVGKGTEREFISVLEDYMNFNGYRYKYTKDVWIPLRFNLVNKKMLDNDFRLKWTHFFFQFKLKHSKCFTYVRNVLYYRKCKQ